MATMANDRVSPALGLEMKVELLPLHQQELRRQRNIRPFANIHSCA